MSAAAVAAALGITLVQGPSTAQADDRNHPWGHSDGMSRVTLITGDHVTIRAVDGQAVPEVAPADGRESMTFHIFDRDGDLYVVPSDAKPLIANGVLDLRLFDVSTLVEYGYTDAERDDIPLIVSGEAVVGTAEAATDRLDGLDISFVEQPKAEADQFWSSMTGAGALSAGDTRIWLDGKRELSLDVSVPQVGAPAAWDAGYTGEGVVVAVLDSGVDETHTDLTSKIVDAEDFTGGGDVTDAGGHGTHVASTIAGGGDASDGQYVGVAPDADLLIGKVCAEYGCQESAILEGMEWAAQSGADIANLSLGGRDTPEIDPLEQAINDLTEEYGILFVVAAGNDYANEAVGSPGSADAALTVGAVDAADELAVFSSRGPRVGDHALKPDITAPGVDIVAAKAEGTQLGEPVGDSYVTASGTSMATPHVAGAVAILAQQHPDYTPAQLKASLMAAAEPNADLMAHQQGAGRLDAARAVSQEVTTEPASVSVGKLAWPQTEVIEDTLTYGNPTDEAITLDLTVTAAGTDGPVDGVVTVNTDSLEIPAGGEADVTVLTDLTGDTAPGYYSAYVTATFGDHRVVTPVAATKEPETHQLTVSAVGADGAPAEGFMVLLFSLSGDTSDLMEFSMESSIDLDIPVGEYHVEVTLDEDSGDVSESHMMIDPSIEVFEDSSLTFDARDTGDISVSIHDKTVGSFTGALGYNRVFGDQSRSSILVADSLDNVHSHQYGDPLPAGELQTEIHGTLTDNVPPSSMAVRELTRTYNYALGVDGYLVTDYEESLTEEDFMRIDNEIRSGSPGQMGQKVLLAVGEFGGLGTGYTMPLPNDFTEFVASTEHFAWDSEFRVVVEDSVGLPTPISSTRLDHPITTTPSETMPIEWNTAVMGPGFAAEYSAAERDGSEATVTLPLFSGPQEGSFGISMTDSGRMALYAGDELIGESPMVDGGDFSGLPDEATQYRLVAEADRSGMFDFTTSLECEWTFTSSASDDTLPLLSVRAAPQGLNETNHVAVGEAVTIPLTVQTISGDVIDPAELGVKVSFDGEVWEEAVVEDGAITVTAEAAGTVSLHIGAVDDDGNAVEQTIMDAYGVK